MPRESPDASVDVDDIEFHGDDGCELFASVVGAGPPLVLLHGGGPDRRSLLPLARLLAGRARVIVPDVRGYGRSTCVEPERHTWQQYANDVISLLDHLAVRRAVVGGCGMGSGIATRAGLSWPARVGGLVLVSPEHRGEERPSADEVAWQEAMADQIRSEGLEAAWAPVLPRMPEGMAAMVRDAFPRTDPTSQGVALRAIASQEPFERLAQLAELAIPVLVIPGGDPRHPRELGHRYQEVLARPLIMEVDMWKDVTDARSFATRIAPAIGSFLDTRPV